MTMARMRFTAFGLLVLIAACGGGEHVPAPVVTEAPPAPSLASGTYTVRPGDNIYGIARELSISARALIDANNLQPPFQLTPGQILSLPGNATYTVAKGDTLLGVARKTGVAFATLARMNTLAPPYTLRIGQRLALPVRREAVVAATPDTVPVSPSPIVTPLAASPMAPVATATLSSPKSPAYTPLAAREAPQPPPAPTAAPTAAPTIQGAPPMAAPMSSPPLTASTTPPVTAAPSSAANPPAEVVASVGHVPSRALHGFIWPVKGDILVAFGSPGKGQHNDGINIAAPRGTPVAASEDGVVAYAGNELRGFGNLLLVKHADGWMSAYAHNETLLVKRGDAVHRGQIIAKVGDSGGVTQPQLHFELRQGVRAVDPEGLLGKPIPEADQADPPNPG